MRNIIPVVTTALLGACMAFATPSMLVYEPSPYSMAVGGGADLLDVSVPITRAYSGLSANKDKLEIAFYHNGSMLINDIGFETVYVSVKDNLFTKGLRVAGFLNYLNLGNLDQLDSRGRLVEKFTSGDLLAGAAFVFDQKSLKLQRQVLNPSNNKYEPNALYPLLAPLNAAVNLTYYQSTLASYSTFSVLADVNLSYKLSVPFIGMPEQLINESDVQLERQRVIGQYKAMIDGKKKELDDQKAISNAASKKAEYDAQFEAYTKRIGDVYGKRQVEIRDVHRTRSNIYTMTYALNQEISGEYVSNFISNANVEMKTLIDTAAKGVNDNGKALNKRINEDIETLYKDATKYRDQFKKNTDIPELVDKANALFDIYEAFAEEQFAAIKRVATQKVTATTITAQDRERGYKEYTIAKGDTWGTIASNFMGDAKRGEDIAVYNGVAMKVGVKELPVPKAGSVVKIPVEQKTADVDEKTYKTVIARGETMRQEIQKYLGDNKRQFTVPQQLYFNGALKSYGKYLTLLAEKEKLITQVKTKLVRLDETYNREVGALTVPVDAMLKDLKKIKLKKELDLLNAAGKDAADEAVALYKKDETDLFKGLLLQLYKSKRGLIEEFIREERAKQDVEVSAVNDVYARKFEVVDESADVAAVDAGKDEAKVKSIREKQTQERGALQDQRAKDGAMLVERFEAVINEYKWQLYLTQLIYLSSEERPYTLAFGGNARNLGIPVKYGTTSEMLPVAASFDVTYNFLRMENNSVTGYLHTGYSELEGVAVGGGAMYRIFESLEFRGGLRINAIQTAGAMTLAGTGGIGWMSDLGLMKYRIDIAGVYEAVYGLSFTAGLSVAF
ncbi:MAG: hypothetical protein HZC28_15215 [Spirochaetes bacterium]|nr:hypothetical protein [Spirochaetota bacterium]